MSIDFSRLRQYIAEAVSHPSPLTNSQEGVMKSAFIQLGKFVLIGFIGVVGSVTLGLMMHGIEVLKPEGINFAYVAFGASGACVFAVYHLRGLSASLGAAIIVSTIQFLAASTWLPIRNSFVWSFGVNLPVVWLAFLFERKLAVFHWGKFIVVGLVYGVMFVLLTLVVGLLQGVEAMPAAMFQQNFLDGMLIGLGMGLGVQGAEAFIHSIEAHAGKR